MTKKTQKKLRKALLLISCAALLVCITVGVTVAYLTDKAEVKNVFTVGKVDIVLKETPVDANGKKTSAEPVEKGNEYTSLKPAQEIDKDPTVTVLKNSEDCYVRMYVTISNASAFDKNVELTEKTIATVFTGYNAADWELKGNEKDEAKNTRTYEFWYTKEVTKDTTDTKLPALFTGIKVPENLTSSQMAELGNFSIDIVANAIQADGFDSAADAWNDFVAE